MNFLKNLYKPIDNSPLIVFRIAFGFLLICHLLSSLSNGTIYRDYIKPPFNFNFIGFDFLQHLQGRCMYFYVIIMVLFALMIMIGAWYRLAMVCFSLLWTGLYLMQKSDYNNHYYLLVLLCWIMIFLPAHHYCSIDVKRNAVTKIYTCSSYCLLIFIAQIAIVYFFAAISKINIDWFSGKYIAIQFSSLSRRPVLGVIYRQHWFQLFICYSGFLLDLLIVPLLLWKTTRNYAFLVSCFFHFFNFYSFHIGIFPFLSIALNVFFFDPVKLRRLVFGDCLIEPVNKKSFLNSSYKQRMLVYCFGIYIFFQTLIPMRSWFFPGNVFWNEEGYRMSWKMMMRTKTGNVYFKVIDVASHNKWIVDPEKIFSRTHVIWLAISPDIIWQYSQRLKADFSIKGFPDVQVFAIGEVSLNRSKPMPLIDSTVNLVAVKWQPFRHSWWVTKGPEH